MTYIIIVPQERKREVSGENLKGVRRALVESWMGEFCVGVYFGVYFLSVATVNNWGQKSLVSFLTGANKGLKIKNH